MYDVRSLRHKGISGRYSPGNASSAVQSHAYFNSVGGVLFWHSDRGGQWIIADGAGAERELAKYSVHRAVTDPLHPVTFGDGPNTGLAARWLVWNGGWLLESSVQITAPLFVQYPQGRPKVAAWGEPYPRCYGPASQVRHT